MDQDATTWDEHLPFVTFAYNTTKQASTGFAAFEVLFAWKAKLPLFLHLQVDNPKTYETETWVNYLNEHMHLIHGTALKNIKKAQEHQKRSMTKESGSNTIIKLVIGR